MVAARLSMASQHSEGLQRHDTQMAATSTYVSIHATRCLLLRSLNQPLMIKQFLSIRQILYMRSLTLIGEYPTSPSLPLVSVLGRVPELSALVLAFALPAHIDRQQIWLYGAASAIPWPKLVDLTVIQETRCSPIFPPVYGAYRSFAVLVTASMNGGS